MNKKVTVTKAVFPVGGLGTRFLPATKANPKEMLPIVDKPLIQYAVEEAVAAGITQLIFVTSTSKRAIEDHFDSNYELESNLESRGNYKLLTVVREILPKGVSCVYVRQPHPKGLGHAILCARSVVGEEPFAVLLADDLMDGEQGISSLQQMMPIFTEQQGSVIAVQKVALSETEKYGIVALDSNQEENGQIVNIIEKPKPNEAPSQLAAVGRYILSPRIFEFLETQLAGKSGEIQLTDAIARLLAVEPVFAYTFKGIRYDCGTKLGYLDATIAMALKHPEVGYAFRDHLKSHLKTLSSKDYQ